MENKKIQTIGDLGPTNSFDEGPSGYNIPFCSFDFIKKNNMEKNVMIPYTKLKDTNFKYVTYYLKEWGYDIKYISKEQISNKPYLIINLLGILGKCALFSEKELLGDNIINMVMYNRIFANNVEDFLYQAAKCFGRTYVRKDIVTKDDLFGKVKGFPIEIVQKMVDYQLEQGNKPDVGVFANILCSRSYEGGFDWCRTSEGEEFWSKIIWDNDFKLFFDKYPKEGVIGPTGPKEYGLCEKEEYLPKVGEYVLVSQNNDTWHRRIFLFKDKDIFYCLGEEDEERFNESGIKCNLSVDGWKYCMADDIKLEFNSPYHTGVTHLNHEEYKEFLHLINKK